MNKMKNINKFNRSKMRFQICAYVLLILCSLFCLAPFIWLVRSSLMTSREIFTLPPMLLPNKPQWKNYVDLFAAVPFARYFLNTLFIVLINVIGALISNTFISYAFARIKFKGSGIMYGICLATLMLPATVTMIPLFIEWKILGGINTYLPLTVMSFFGNAFYIFMLHQFFKSIPYEYDEAAFVDGANHFQIVLKIIVPVSKPALAVVAIFSFLTSWNDFMGPFLYINDQSKYTLSLGLKYLISGFSVIGQWQILMAAAVLIILPITMLFFFMQRYFIEGLTMGGLKG
jgi:multiple sugar transport system permease protein